MKKGISVMVLFLSILSLSVEGHAKGKKEEATNGLDQNAVRKVVRAHLQDVQKCYTDLIIEGMATKGKVTATWDIDDQGKAQNLAVKENTAKDPALDGCVTERVVNWNFPPAESGKTFQATYTFDFGN